MYILYMIEEVCAEIRWQTHSDAFCLKSNKKELIKNKQQPNEGKKKLYEVQ